MKRTKIYILLILLGLVFVFNSCSKKDDEKKTLSCEELESNYVAALTAFMTTPTEATCNAFEKSIEDFVDGCAILTPAEKQEFQDSLDENDCSEFNTGK